MKPEVSRSTLIALKATRKAVNIASDVLYPPAEIPKGDNPPDAPTAYVPTPERAVVPWYRALTYGEVALIGVLVLMSLVTAMVKLDMFPVRLWIAIRRWL